jgi:type 1 glutamine amidotransferase
MTRVVILSGVTGTDDPWHDFQATSAAVASCLSDIGWTCTVVTTVEATSASLRQADLLIVNSGLHSPPGPDDLPDHLASPRPVLGLHAAANTFAAMPQWTQRLGVRWIEGLSMHPPIGWQRLIPTSPMLGDLDEVVVYDELYSNLDVLQPATVVLAHHLDGVDQPLILARETGPQRTIYDALGHGTESYASPSRQELLRREAHWLLADG